MSKVLVPLGKGFEEIEATAIVDVLRRAEIDVKICSIESDLLIEGANGITLKADCFLSDVDSKSYDMIVLPGGWDGTYALADSELVQSTLKEFDRAGKKIGAICAAPFALNKAGVLKENYTCYPSVEEQIKKGSYSDKERVVRCENVITSRGPATAICFGLEIVKDLKGEETYNALKAGLLADFC